MKLVCSLFCRNMASHMWVLSLSLLLMACGAMGGAPRKPISVSFGRNYVPTWAFDHIKYFNGGSEIQLSLDKYTGNLSFSAQLCCHNEILSSMDLSRSIATTVEVSFLFLSFCISFVVFIFLFHFISSCAYVFTCCEMSAVELIELLNRYWIPVEGLLLVWSFQYANKDGSRGFCWNGDCFLCKWDRHYQRSSNRKLLFVLM